MEQLINDIRKIYKDRYNYSFAVSVKTGQKYNLIDRRKLSSVELTKLLNNDDLLIPVDIMVRIIHNIVSISTSRVMIKTLITGRDILNVEFAYDISGSFNDRYKPIRIIIYKREANEKSFRDYLSVYVSEITSVNYMPVDYLLGQLFLEDLFSSPESLSQRIKNLIIQKNH